MLQMKWRQCWFCAVILAVPAILGAQQPATPEQLIQAVHKVADLSQAGPYLLTADVVVSPGDPKREKTGHLTIERDHDRSRFEFQLGDYREVRTTIGNKTYFPAGSSLLFGTGLNYFDRSWDPALDRGVHTEKISVGKVATKMLNGQEARCFNAQTADSKRDLCIEADHPLLLRSRASDSSFEFFDYTAAGQQWFPRRVAIHRSLMANMEIRNISVSFHPIDAARFAIPDQAIEIETCDPVQHPTPISTPEPSYTEKARREGREGTLLVYAVVAKDGTVNNVEVLNPDDAGLDQNTVGIVRTWRFKPAVCEGHPVAAEMLVEMDFRLR